MNFSSLLRDKFKTSSVYKVIVAQLVWTVSLSLVCLSIFGVVAGYSALLGGLISAVPNSYFALHALNFRVQETQIK